MEGKNMKVISLVLIVMFGMFVGKSAAFDKVCYVGCLAKCAITHPGDKMLICPVKCLGKCIFALAPNTVTTQNDYCKFGCAVSNCVKNSTTEDTRGDEVEYCVNSRCGNMCIN
ncbi:hypothetical protein MKW94_016704 [Papaver nudicaule]|uniref:Thionin-like protein n=1 Tax=Papaver nudicaule TaxID=74823 RepID=A0AA41V3Q8_PAPNU|nr:hypothetical protein [Papaver nudicaule]